MFLRMNGIAQRLGIVAMLCVILLAVAAANANADVTPAASSVLDPPWLTHTAEPWEALNIFTFSTDVYMDVPPVDLWSDPWEWMC